MKHRTSKAFLCCLGLIVVANCNERSKQKEFPKKENLINENTNKSNPLLEGEEGVSLVEYMSEENLYNDSKNKISLKAVLTTEDGYWTVWVNDLEINSAQNREIKIGQGLWKIIEVNKNSVKFSQKEGREIILSVAQEYDSDTQEISNIESTND